MAGRTKAHPMISANRIVHDLLIMLMTLPLLLAAGEEASAQRGRKESPRRESTRKHEPSRAPTKARRPEPRRPTPPSPARDLSPDGSEEPYADLAAEVVRDVSSPGGNIRRSLYAPTIPLTELQLTQLAAYRREGSRIPPRPYAAVADHVINPAPIYGEARLGLYSTADLQAGIAGRSWPYDYLLSLRASTTEGSSDNARRSDLSVDASGGYVINNNAWIFSGGHMGAEVSYGRRSLALYALATPPDRSIQEWGVALTGANTFLDDEFTLQGRYRGLTLDDDDGANVREHALEGRVTVGTPWMGFVLEGDAMLSLASMSGTAIPFTRVSGGLSLRRQVVTLHAGGALSTGENSDGSSVTRVTPTARATITPTPGISFAAEATGGIGQWKGADLLAANPYALMSSGVVARHEDQKIGYRGELRIDPTEWFGLHLSVSHAPYASYVSYGSSENGRFRPLFQETTIDQVTGETMIRFDDNNLFTGLFRFAETTLDESNRPLPFTPRWFIEAMHSARIAPLPLSVIVGVRYIGTRIDGSGETMKDVVLLSMEGRYRLNSLLEATAIITNPLDTRYQIWQGYDERGIHAALGLALRH